jgi:FixH
VAELVTAGLPRVGVGARSGARMPGTGNGHGDGAASSSPSRSSNGSHNGTFNGSSDGAVDAVINGSASESIPDSGRAAVTLGKLRWSVAAEAMLASAVLAVTAVLVNTPTAREGFTQPVSATAAFNTGGPGGRGDVNITVTPAVLGPNQVRVSVTGSEGKPYRPQQIQVALELPARHLGPLAVPVKADGPGRYASGSVTMTITGQWQLQITIRSDAFDETTVVVPVPVH